MTKVTSRLRTAYQRDQAKRLIDRAPVNYVMHLAEETRNDRQNRALWAKIEDIRKQLPNGKQWTKEQWKARFMNALGVEMQFLPDLEEQGFFPVGHSSRTLTVEQFGALLTLIEAYGARHGVEWTDPKEMA